mmetsp:Transcript_34865/g.84334  ORF Transcript_34865/g.84334 Transcript_34865/m.84334 type:complete len:596 (-) Transcript_34865:288-2075(-)
MSQKEPKGRLASFKPTVDANETRRRREETTLIIRKTKKDEQMKKRRKNGGRGGDGSRSDAAAAGAGTGTSGMMVDSSSSTTLLGDDSNPPTPTAQDIASLATNLNQYRSLDHPQLLEVVRGIRRHLMAGREFVVDQVISYDMPSTIVAVMHNNTTDVVIMYESFWALLNIASQSKNGAYAVADTGVIPFAVQCLQHFHPQVRLQAAWCLANITGEDVTLRDRVLAVGGGGGGSTSSAAVNAVVENLAQAETGELLENFVYLASNLCRGNGGNNIVEPFVAPAAQLLKMVYHQGRPNISDDACMDALWALTYLSDGDSTNSMIQSIMDTDILSILMSMVTEPGLSRFMFCALRCLGNFCSGNAVQTQQVIDTGIFQVVESLLNHPKKSIRQGAGFLLSNIAAGTSEQKSSLMKYPGLLVAIVQHANDGIWEVRKECIWVLVNLFDTEKDICILQLVQHEGLEPLCSVLSLEVTGPSLLVEILDALEKVMNVGIDIGVDYSKVIEEYHGIQAIEDLQEHQSDAVYEKAVHIIETYFVDDDEENDEALAPKTQGDTFAFGLDLASPKQLFSGSSQQHQRGSQPAFEFGGLTSSNVMFP